MDDPATLDTLHELIATCIDNGAGFRRCADRAGTADLKQLFSWRAGECLLDAEELRGLLDGGGGRPLAAPAALAPDGAASPEEALPDRVLLDDCARREEVALQRYRHALEQPLPAAWRDVVQCQCEAVARHHAQLVSLREHARSL